MCERLAVYTTVYPSSERFLPAWSDSLAAQTDQDFDLWIGIDGIPTDRLEQVWGDRSRVTYVPANAGDPPAAVRARAWDQMVQRYDAIVLVDSDDVAAPSRVAAARSSLAASDVAGCALAIMDESGDDLGHVFGPPDDADLGSLLARHNVYGLSNSAYRAEALRACLPVPADCRLIDWLLATRAWAAGARMTFDHTPRMHYRQYSENTARVIGPFTEDDVLGATALVVQHYRFALSTPQVARSPAGPALAQAEARALRFRRAICASGTVLRAYLHELNRTPAAPMWWWCVAHPALESIWSH
jgi:hypothetical protein